MTIITVKTGGIAADAVTDAKIADDVVGTEHLTANEVDTAALAADAVTGAQLADDAVNSEHYTDGSIDTAHLADGQVTTAKLATAVFTAATDIGAAIVDADLFLMDDGAGGTIRKTTAARIKTYVGGGLSVADNWRLTADLGTDKDAGGITANLEQVDTSPQGTIGTAMSLSSGVFTFPSTGTYFIAYNSMISTNGNDNVSISIFATPDNSNYILAAIAFGGAYDDQVVTAYCNTLLNVDNTSNVKVKFSVSSLNSGSVIRGDTATNETGMVFIRLGDST